MYSWHVSVANLSAKPEEFEEQLAGYVKKHFEDDPPKRHVADEKEHQAKTAAGLARRALDELLAVDLPKARKLTRDELAANAKAKKERPDADPPHPEPALAVSVSISGVVPSGESGDHTTLSISVSLG